MSGHEHAGAPAWREASSSSSSSRQEAAYHSSSMYPTRSPSGYLDDDQQEAQFGYATSTATAPRLSLLTELQQRAWSRSSRAPSGDRLRSSTSNSGGAGGWGEDPSNDDFELRRRHRQRQTSSQSTLSLARQGHRSHPPPGSRGVDLDSDLDEVSDVDTLPPSDGAQDDDGNDNDSEWSQTTSQYLAEQKEQQEQLKEALEQLELALKVILCPLIGKWIGRKWAYAVFSRYQAHGGLSLRFFGLSWIPETNIPNWLAIFALPLGGS